MPASSSSGLSQLCADVLGDLTKVSSPLCFLLQHCLIGCWLPRGGTVCLLRCPTRSRACLGYWHHRCPATGATAAMLRYSRRVQRKSRVLTELPLPCCPSLDAGRPVQDLHGRLDNEKRPALQGVCSPAGGRRGMHRWQQMLSSVKTIEAKQKTKKT